MPELSSAWDALLNISIADKKYDETAQLLTEFGRLHPHADLKGLVAGETSYADFRKSDAYQAWISKSAGAETM